MDARRLFADIVSAAARPRPQPAAGAAPAERAGAAAPASYDPALLVELAAKVLQHHLRARRSSLQASPEVFAGVSADEAVLLIRAMIAAAYADGRLSAQEHGRIRRALAAVGSTEEEREFLARELREPVALEALLREVRDGEAAARFYGASLLAVDRHERVNRAFLQYLAGRLQLPPEVVVRLHRSLR